MPHHPPPGRVGRGSGRGGPALSEGGLRNPVAARRGFTLLELLLTLAVMAALAAIVIPSYVGLLGDRRLVRGGDVVRVEMIKARLAAMRSGRTQMLRFQLGQGVLTVRPWHAASDMTEAADMVGTGSALLQGGTPMLAPNAPASGQSEAQQIELPEGILIVTARVESTVRSSGIETQTSSEQAAGWSQPILFYADGTTSTAAVTVQESSEKEPGTGPRLIVMLRGLTGEPTLSEVLP